MRKPMRAKTKLLVPTSAMFLSLTILIVFSAYVLFSNNVRSNSLKQLHATSQQVLNNYETYFDSVIEVSNALLGEYSNENEDNISSDMQNYFDSIMSIKHEIEDISIYRKSDGALLASSSNYVDLSNDVELENWFVDAKENPLINIFSPSSVSSTNTYHFLLSKVLFFEKNRAFDGVLRVDFDFTKIVESISSTTLGAGGSFIIYDKNYNIVYCSDSTYLESELPLIKHLVLGNSIVSVDKHSLYLYCSSISNTSWRLAIFINNDAIASAIYAFSVYIIVLMIFVIAIFFILMVIVANNITDPLQELQKEMAKIESFNYEGYLHHNFSSTYEISELNRSFNQMMTRIKKLNTSLITEKEEQRKSELKALQNQINPHFLYNTLDSIIALIEKGDDETAQLMIIALSRFFRISISSGKNVIPLNKEIEHVRNYLLIQKMRFGNSFKYKINVEDGLDEYPVIKLILQPIVENSIGHGIKEGEEGFISINVHSEDAMIVFEIKDNGYGMTKAKVEELSAAMRDASTYKGVGLKNVYQRIRIYYGPSADVVITSEEDIGTTIKIIIPKVGIKDEE